MGKSVVMGMRIPLPPGLQCLIENPDLDDLFGASPPIGAVGCAGLPGVRTRRDPGAATTSTNGRAECRRRSMGAPEVSAGMQPWGMEAVERGLGHRSGRSAG